MNRMRAAIGLFGIATQFGLVSPDYAVFDPRERINESFVLHLVKTRAMRTVFRVESKGLGTGSSGFLRLYSDRFGVIKIALPPLSEQEATVRHLEAVLGDINFGIDRANREIDLLGEYRVRLVAEVVTGKLDVRAAAAVLPETIEEPEDFEAGMESGDEQGFEDTDEVEEAA